MNQYKLYGGKVILLFNEKRHIYSVKGKKVWGVTSIVNVLDKPALLYWVANQTVEFLEKKLIPGQALDELEIKWLLDEAKKAFRIRRDKAADVGVLTHAWIESYIRAGLAKEKLPALPKNKEMRACLRGFFQWIKENKVKFLESERKCYSRKYGYAGTTDVLAIMNGKRTVIDIKTGKAIYPEHFLQTAAYLKAIEEEEKRKYTGGILILRLSKENKKKGIKAFEFEVARNGGIEKHFKCFLNCLGVYGWKMELKKKELKEKYGK